MHKPTFIMMVGLPYSGKSVHADFLAADSDTDIVIHSSDAIRVELFGDVQDQEHNAKVFEVLHQRILDDLHAGKSVIYDATNLSYKRRINILERLSKIDCEKLCFFMATPFDEIMERSKHRDRVVPYEVLERMYKSIWIPNVYEGWDEVDIVYPNGFGGFKPRSVPDLLTRLRTIPHDNPHHTLSIGDHCIAAQRQVWQMDGCSRELEIAALLHDIGKEFTKAFVNSKGEPSEVAHYYEHHHVSAYDSLFYVPDDVDRLHVAAVIQWHMRPFQIDKSPQPNREYEKFKVLVGERIYNDVMALHTADLAAH